MTGEVYFERIEPEKRCSDPEEHWLMDFRTFRDGKIPSRTICRRCGEPGTIVVLPYDEGQLTRD